VRIGSLFDGIGGFPLAFSKHGFVPVWASEIEKVPIEITKRHFPKMKHLGDITKIKGSDVEPVDVITFGSPCQDLSVAGKGKGLAGERSGLFLEAIRIIREMRLATDGIYPRFAVWENVPGAFSSNKGQDFRTVLEKICETEVPMPQSGRWAAAGMVRVPECTIYWRTLDAQYWGVPQRRKRIFLVADYSGGCRPEILFERESLRRDFETSREAREGASCYAGTSLEKQDHALTLSNVASTLRAGAGAPKHEADYVGRSVLYPTIVGTLAACAAGLNRPSANGNALDFVVAIQGNSINRSDNAGCDGTGEKENISYTLNMVDRHAVAFAQNQRNEIRNLGDKSAFLSSQLGMKQQTYLCMASGQANAEILKDKSPAITCLHEAPIVNRDYQVRRITPLECERLQGFPDGWTEGFSDTQRYKALGNSVAIPCVERIAYGIKEARNG
jgi:DNA (cytosine-5)-methyltransferase 1